MLAVTVAFGGGTLRDVLLGRRPFFWVASTEYLLVALVLTVCFVYSRRVFAFATWLDGHATFGRTAEDLRTLRKIAGVAATLSAPFVATAAPGWYTLEDVLRGPGPRGR
jgi:lysylphosphatidylglycerol synthetase-like protein (DUF2156 family)